MFYRKGYRDGLLRAMEIAENTGRGEIAANAILCEITRRQLIDDMKRKRCRFRSLFWLKNWGLKKP